MSDPADKPLPHRPGRLAAVIGLDVRSLAVWRVLTSLLLLVEFAYRASFLTAWSTTLGAMPPEAVQAYNAGTWRWSLHLLSGSYAFQAAMLALSTLFALMLLVGYRTRLATLATWLLLTSLHAATPLVTSGGGTLMRIMLLWSIFLPLGCVWSIDARRQAGVIASSRPVVSIASLAVVVQIAMLYIVAGVLKLNESWLQGDALQNALGWEMFRRPLGVWLFGYPGLLRLLNYGTLLLEILGPLLLFIPWRTGICRLISIAAFIGFHVTVELCMDVGNFSYAGIAVWTILLPPGFWNSRLIVTISKDTGSADSTNSIELPCSPAIVSGRRLSQSVCAALLAIAVSSGVCVSLHHHGCLARIPKLVSRGANFFSVNQRWTMFRQVHRQHAWFVGRARLRDGHTVDLLRSGEEIDWDELDRKDHAHGVERGWRRAFTRLKTNAYGSFRQPVAEYLCYDWNQRHQPEQQIVLMELVCCRPHLGRQASHGEFSSRVYARVEAESWNDLPPLFDSL